jgi:hypothetical protein
MNYPALIVEAVSAVLCLVLVRFMTKPYRATGESRYLGLPVGFALLGFSYIFMITALFFESFPLVDEIKWLRLFTEAYAFAFIALTYLFSKKPAKNSRLLWNSLYAVLVLTAVFLYLLLVEPPTYGLPDYRIANRDILLFNIVCIAYVSIFTLRNHFLRPDPETMLVPFGYLLLGFSQYSLLILSIGSNLVAFAGASFLRVLGLLIFVWVSYNSFYVSRKQPREEGVVDEKATP